MKDFMSTTIPQVYSNGLYREIGYDFPAEHADKILTTTVYGITSCLANIKNKDIPVAFVIREPNDEFIIGAVVEYFKNEDDPSKPGNWNYSWTFDKDDIPENAKVCSLYDGEYSAFFTNASANKFNMGFHKYEYFGDMSRYLFKVIKKWLKDNAGKTDENGVAIDGVECPGVIQFRVAVENDEVVMSAEPDGEIKQMIKDDAAIEK